MFDIVIYCDGASKGNPGLGGWGALIVDEKKNVDELGAFCPDVTNNQMELTAVIKSLEFIESYKGKSIIILTDSSYVIKGIKDWVFGWKSLTGKHPQELKLKIRNYGRVSIWSLKKLVDQKYLGVMFLGMLELSRESRPNSFYFCRASLSSVV